MFERYLFLDLTPKESGRIQRILFDNGYRWYGFHPYSIRHTDMPALTTTEDGFIRYHLKSSNAIAQKNPDDLRIFENA